jgi:hypothetical protein
MAIRRRRWLLAAIIRLPMRPAVTVRQRVNGNVLTLHTHMQIHRRQHPNQVYRTALYSPFPGVVVLGGAVQLVAAQLVALLGDVQEVVADELLRFRQIDVLCELFQLLQGHRIVQHDRTPQPVQSDSVSAHEKRQYSENNGGTTYCGSRRWYSLFPPSR